MATYVPGTQEKDLTKVIMSLQQVAPGLDAANTGIATNTANIATNAANIATNTTNISTLQTVATNLGAPLKNSLGADVALNNTTNYFDGPSVAQGTTGTFLATGTVTVFDSATAVLNVKLWDGTTIIDSTTIVVLNTTTVMPVALSGAITNPAGNIRISVRDITNTTGKILFNQSGNSKDSTLTVVRLG